MVDERENMSEIQLYKKASDNLTDIRKVFDSLVESKSLQALRIQALRKEQEELKKEQAELKQKMRE